MLLLKKITVVWKNRPENRERKLSMLVCFLILWEKGHETIVKKGQFECESLGGKKLKISLALKKKSITGANGKNKKKIAFGNLYRPKPD